MKMPTLSEFFSSLESSPLLPDSPVLLLSSNETNNGDVINQQAFDQKPAPNIGETPQSSPPEFAFELASATLNQHSKQKPPKSALKNQVVFNSNESTPKKEKPLKKAPEELVFPLFPTNPQLVINHSETNFSNALPSVPSKLELDKHPIKNKDRNIISQNEALPQNSNPSMASASSENTITKLEHHTHQEALASLPDLSRPTPIAPSVLPHNSIPPGSAPDVHNTRPFTPSLNLPTPSHPAAPIYAQAMEDSTLRMQVQSATARLSCQIDGEELKLHLRVRDKIADVRIEGTASELFRHRSLELGAALASEGLQLGGFDLSQEQQRNPYPSYSFDEDPSPPGTTSSSPMVKTSNSTEKENASSSISLQNLPGTLHLEV